MTDLLLYTLVIPQDSQSDLLNRLQQQLATAGVLDQDGGVVEQLSSEPGNQTISGLYRDQFAAKMAAELEELAQASGFDELPVASLDGATSTNGYYSLERADVDQVQPHTSLVQQFDLSLTKKGTQNKHWRALETNPRQVDHDFGTDLAAEVAVPAAASKVQWYNPADGSRPSATPVETRSAELGDVDIYDLTDAPWYDPFGEDPPTLLYEVPYIDEEATDVRVYDTLGAEQKLNAEYDLQWQKVFSTQHDFGGEVVIDTGLLRLRLDEGAGTLEAERWDPDATQTVEGTGTYGDGLYGEGLYAGQSGDWVDAGLSQPADVSVFDVDLVEISMATVRAQVLLDDSGTLFALDVVLDRGVQDALFSIPENESGPIPTALQDWLSPIATTTLVDPQAEKTTVARDTTRK